MTKRTIQPPTRDQIIAHLEARHGVEAASFDASGSIAVADWHHLDHTRTFPSISQFHSPADLSTSGLPDALLTGDSLQRLITLRETLQSLQAGGRRLTLLEDATLRTLTDLEFKFTPKSYTPEAR